MKKFLFSLLLSVAFLTRLLSQGTDISGTSKPGLFVGFNIIPAQTAIINDIPVDYSANSSGAISLHGSLEMGYFFSKNIGISLGFGYGGYSAKLSIQQNESSFSSSDSEDDTFQMRITGNQIVEEQKLSFLNIPLCAILQFPIGNKLDIFIQPGFQMAFPLNKKYTDKGVFTYNGYYSQYNVLLTNLPDYGFPSNYNTSVSNELKVKPQVTSLLVSAGINYSLSPGLQLLIGINYSKSLADLSAYEENPEFHISEFVDNMNSLMGVSSNTSIQAFGFRLGMRYLIK
jgi:hypothetical protein